MSDPKKKILVLFGSPHKEGFTRQLAESFLAPFRDSGEWEVEEWDAYERQARPCLGCGACQKAEACALHDLDGWDRALRDSDFLAVAAPVYNASFPAPVKAMLDRTQRYFEARFALGKKPSIAKHREAALLLTMGSEDEFALEVCSHQLGRAFSVMNTSLTGQAVWAATDRPEEHRTEALARARELGESCARAQPGKEGPRPLELRQVREESPEFPRVVELYREAFPQGERSSLVPLLEDETGGGEILSLWDGEVFAGMACLLRTQRLAHLIYFAVAPELRDRGLGSRALAAFRRRYPETPLVVDIERPWEGARNNGQRKRRKAFYLRAGFRETPVHYWWRGEPYELLSTGSLSQRDWETFWKTIRRESPQLSEY